MDNQEYNFADESPEVISTIPTDIVLEDAVPEPLVSLNVKGNSEQKQYEGYNLIPYPHTNISIDGTGITWTEIGDGTISAKGTASVQCQYTFSFNKSFPAGNYIAVGCPANGGNGKYLINFAAAKDEVYIKDSWDTGSGMTISAPNGIDRFIVSLRIYAGQTVDFVFKPMLCTGSAIRPYEPYVGGIPSPNPEYPQSVNSTSDSEVNLSIHSRNLLDLTKFEDRGGITSTLTPTGISMTYSGSSDYISISATVGDEPDFYDTYLTLSGNYTISGNYGELIMTGFEIFYYASGNPGVTILGNASMYGSGKFSMVSTRRVPAYVPGAELAINLYFRNRTGTTTDAVIEWSDIMLERGSTATDYQPYFRDTVDVPVSSGIVLRGLGGIYDELIVENGTVKNIQRITPFTTPAWNEFYLNDASLIYYNRNVYQLVLYNSETDPSRIERSLSTEENSIGLCSHYKNISLGTMFADLYYADYYGTEPPQNRISIIENHLLIYKNNESLEDFIQWWNANKDNVKIYYALKTPIETDITNTTVGQQLLQLSTERGLNTMHIIADVNPSEIKTKYWKQIR